MHGNYTFFFFFFFGTNTHKTRRGFLATKFSSVLFSTPNFIFVFNDWNNQKRFLKRDQFLTSKIRTKWVECLYLKNDKILFVLLFFYHNYEKIDPQHFRRDKNVWPACLLVNLNFPRWILVQKLILVRQVWVKKNERIKFKSRIFLHWEMWRCRGVQILKKSSWAGCCWERYHIADVTRIHNQKTFLFFLFMKYFSYLSFSFC